jgi:hypothetical protein
MNALVEVQGDVTCRMESRRRTIWKGATGQPGLNGHLVAGYPGG